MLIRLVDDSNLGGINEEKDHYIIADNLGDFKESNVRNGTKSKCKVIALGTNNQNVCSKLAAWVGSAEEEKDNDILATRWESQNDGAIKK